MKYICIISQCCWLWKKKFETLFKISASIININLIRSKQDQSKAIKRHRMTGVLKWRKMFKNHEYKSMHGLSKIWLAKICKLQGSHSKEWIIETIWIAGSREYEWSLLSVYSFTLRSSLLSEGTWIYSHWSWILTFPPSLCVNLEK